MVVFSLNAQWLFFPKMLTGCFSQKMLSGCFFSKCIVVVFSRYTPLFLLYNLLFIVFIFICHPWLLWMLNICDAFKWVKCYSAYVLVMFVILIGVDVLIVSKSSGYDVETHSFWHFFC